MIGGGNNRKEGRCLGHYISLMFITFLFWNTSYKDSDTAEELFSLQNHLALHYVTSEACRL